MANCLIVFALLLGAANALPVTLKSRYMSKVGRQEWLVNHTVVDWEPSQTAIVVVDMWDVHWCVSLSVCYILAWVAAPTPVRTSSAFVRAAAASRRHLAGVQ